MLTPFLFLAGIMTFITLPGLIALHLEEKRSIKTKREKVA